MDKRKPWRAPLLIALAAVATVMLAACGSSGSSSDPSAAQGAAARGSASSTAQAGMAQFAQCMRQNGVTNFPDPQNGHFVMGGDVQSNPHFHSAIQICQHYLGASGIGSGSNNGTQSAQLAFAHCMQTHGVPSFPDPQSDGAIVAPSASVRNSPAYQTAFNECKSNLPNGGSGLQG